MSLEACGWKEALVPWPVSPPSPASSWGPHLHLPEAASSPRDQLVAWTEPVAGKGRLFCQTLSVPTHHVQDALVVGDDDTGVVHLQLLAALYLKAKAIDVLEGPDEPADDAEGGRCQ